jgi:hypothetical protein
VLRLIADAAFTNEIDATRLRAEIPNLRQLFDDALVRRDIATCAQLLQPLPEIASFTDWA